MTTLTDQCEQDWLVYLPPPTVTLPPGLAGCPTPSQCPEIAYLGEPNSFRNVNFFSGLRLKPRVITADYTATVIDVNIYALADSGPIQIVLPMALGTGQFYRITKGDASSNPVIAVPASGDLIDGDSVFVLGGQFADVGIIDADVGVWDKIGLGVGDTGGDFALLSSSNAFVSLNSFRGIQLGTRLVSDDDDISPLDFALYVNASDGPVRLTLPAATGSGQFYRIQKIDADADAGGDIVTVAASGDDLIGEAGEISIWDQYGGALLIDALEGYWDNIGTEVGHGTPVQTDVLWWYRPEIVNDTLLKAWPTVGVDLNSRLDVLYPDGMRFYILRASAADPADPGHKAPNDYHATNNNVHWQQQ